MTRRVPTLEPPGLKEQGVSGGPVQGWHHPAVDRVFDSARSVRHTGPGRSYPAPVRKKRLVRRDDSQSRAHVHEMQSPMLMHPQCRTWGSVCKRRRQRKGAFRLLGNELDYWLGQVGVSGKSLGVRSGGIRPAPRCSWPSGEAAASGA